MGVHWTTVGVHRTTVGVHWTAVGVHWTAMGVKIGGGSEARTMVGVSKEWWDYLTTAKDWKKPKPHPAVILNNQEKI